MRVGSLHLAAALLLGTLWIPACAQQQVIPIPNGGFEQGLDGWSIRDGGMSAISDEQAASGRFSLKIVDTSDSKGSDVTATSVKTLGPGGYEIRGKYFGVSGSGLGVYVRALDKDGRVTNGEAHMIGLGGSTRKWSEFTAPFFVGADAVALQVWLHSYAAAQVEGYVDDLEITYAGNKPLPPPWTPQYKIKPNETARLTAADVVGPDGVVYPNWTRCGVQGGIPDVKPVCTIEQYGGHADDDVDDSAALLAACEAVGKAGGGAVTLGAGTYYLDHQITIRYGGVVIRGQGPDKTRLIFRYALPASGIAFYYPAAGAKVGRTTPLELHAAPTGLMKMHILVDDRPVGDWERSTHSGNTFNFARSGRDIIGKLPDGPHTLKGIAEYQKGEPKTVEIPIVLDSNYSEPAPVPTSTVAINFTGTGYTGPRLLLAKDGLRGATVLELQSTEGLSAGDWICLDGPATERWKKLTKNACQWGTYRRTIVQIKRVEGNTVTLDQPLRIEFPVADGSYVQKVLLTERCGVEDLYLEQTQNLWITTVQFSMALNCWARNVKVYKHGRFPIYGSMAKFCEIRDCVFDDAWFKGGGGTAYTGWEVSYDCLMDGIETFKLRHAPLFQWSASGCVIRNGVFHQSDGQWHSGWTNECLFENCVIDSTTTANGGYGYGMWASPPEDTAHGPNGPRNVIYNCDTESLKDGLWMGGMNEGWLVLYNRYVVRAGCGVSAKTASFDHIIRGNVFVLKDGKSPLLRIQNPDCSGIELVDNKLYGGNGQFSSGALEPAVSVGNQAFPLGDVIPARPTPPVPSIYEWEKAHCPAR